MNNELECKCKFPLIEFNDNLELYCSFCNGYIEMDVDE